MEKKYPKGQDPRKNKDIAFLHMQSKQRRGAAILDKMEKREQEMGLWDCPIIVSREEAFARMKAMSEQEKMQLIMMEIKEQVLDQYDNPPVKADIPRIIKGKIDFSQLN